MSISVAFKERPLLDVQFDERRVGAGSQSIRPPASPENRPPFVRRRATGPSVTSAALLPTTIEQTGEQPAPRHPMPNRVGSSEVNRTRSIDRARLEFRSPQRANRFEPTQHADRSVETSRIGNRVAVRSGRHWRQRGLPSRPSRERVPHRIFAHDERRLGEERLRVRTGAQIHLAEHDPRNGGRGRLGERRERLEPAVTRAASAEAITAPNPALRHAQGAPRLEGRIPIPHPGRMPNPWMPIPVLVDQIFRGLLAERAKPLRATRPSR